MSMDQPNFNLRGHKAGVTALCHGTSYDKIFLLSGDQDGKLILWDLVILRRITNFDICQSRIQTIRLIRLNINQVECVVLVVQSRDHGIHLLKLSNELTMTKFKDFPSHASLFSKGDAINDSNNEAILAYPSVIDSHLIIIRYLGRNAETIISGSAMRDGGQYRHSCAVFDIRIWKNTTNYGRLMFAAYEDGHVCCFSFRAGLTVTDKLGATGLKIDLMLNCDTNFHDFVSAYDVLECQSQYVIICGAPKKELVKLRCDSSFKAEPLNETISLKRLGTSAIAIKPDKKKFAIAGWDNSLRLFDVETCQEITMISNHLNQIQDIIFIDVSSQDDESGQTEGISQDSSKDSYICAASLDGTISLYKSD